ncbi:MAG: hypothetical protein Q4A15_02020 [Prevotellaceae bacterium]|nr:hypothetical protein [Prevotellaceae bacterium]
MLVSVTVEVSDDFIKGNCYDCPFAYHQFNERYDSYDDICVITLGECPLEVVEQ